MHQFVSPVSLVIQNLNCASFLGQTALLVLFVNNPTEHIDVLDHHLCISLADPTDVRSSAPLPLSTSSSTASIVHHHRPARAASPSTGPNAGASSYHSPPTDRGSVTSR